MGRRWSYDSTWQTGLGAETDKVTFATIAANDRRDRLIIWNRDDVGCLVVALTSAQLLATPSLGWIIPTRGIMEFGGGPNGWPYETYLVGNPVHSANADTRFAYWEVLT